MVDLSKYKKMFIDETMENITLVNDTLVSFEQDSEDKDAVQTLFRAFHSIKGMAASMNYQNILIISHKLEDLLDGLRSGKFGHSRELVDTLYSGADILEKMVRIIKEDSDEKVDTSPLIEKLVRKLYKKVMTLRLVPVSLLADIIPRVMR